MNPILIVEDNEKNLKLLRDVLQFKGYATIEARTGSRGLAPRARSDSGARADGHPASRISSGITALRQLRADPLTRDDPGGRGLRLRHAGGAGEDHRLGFRWLHHEADRHQELPRAGRALRRKAAGPAVMRSEDPGRRRRREERQAARRHPERQRLRRRDRCIGDRGARARRSANGPISCCST